MTQSWFKVLFGVNEAYTYDETKGFFHVLGDQLVCLPSNRSFRIGEFEHASLASLRQSETPARAPGSQRHLCLTVVHGDVADLQADPRNRFATFQASSGFNCLALPGPQASPEDGITNYQRKNSQAAACAVSCGAAAAFRNYCVPIDVHHGHGDASVQYGQTSACMLDGLAPLLQELDIPENTGFKCQGGYTLATAAGLAAVNAALARLAAGRAEELVRVGLHEDTQVTSTRKGQQPHTDAQQLVNQVFAPACSIARSGTPDRRLWQPIATAVLRAAYEATLWVALRSAQRHWGRHGSRRAFLTLVGGGGFGNPAAWVCNAMDEALWRFRGSGLEVAVVVVDGNMPAELEALLKLYGDYSDVGVNRSSIIRPPR